VPSRGYAAVYMSVFTSRSVNELQKSHLLQQGMRLNSTYLVAVVVVAVAGVCEYKYQLYDDTT